MVVFTKFLYFSSRYSGDFDWISTMRLVFNRPPKMGNIFGEIFSPKELLNVRGKYMDISFNAGYTQKLLRQQFSEIVSCFALCCVKYKKLDAISNNSD